MSTDSDPKSNSNMPIDRIVIWGGLAGLIAGLGLWFWPDSPSRDRSGTSTGDGPRSVFAPFGSVLPAMGTLSDSPLVQSASPVAEIVDESPRSAGLRYVWFTRYQAGDYRAALDTILDAELDEEELQRHLGDLIDTLIRADWYEEANYPYSNKIHKLLYEPNGRNRLHERWDLARTTVSSIDPSPRKVRLLARLELVARMITETVVNLKPEKMQRDVPQGLVETDEKGNVLATPASDDAANGRKIPLFDHFSTTESIRKEIESNIESLTARNSISYVSSTGWSFLRTGLLSLIGALTAGIGGLVVKTYSESIAARLPAPFWSIALVNRFLRKPQPSNPSEETGPTPFGEDAH